MSEKRLERLEDMMEQLIGMVGNVISEQREMKEEMKSMNQRLERIEQQNVAFHDTNSYLMDKITQHDHDIHVLKNRLLRSV